MGLSRAPGLASLGDATSIPFFIAYACAVPTPHRGSQPRCGTGCHQVPPRAPLTSEDEVDAGSAGAVAVLGQAAVGAVVNPLGRRDGDGGAAVPQLPAGVGGHLPAELRRGVPLCPAHHREVVTGGEDGLRCPHLDIVGGSWKGGWQGIGTQSPAGCPFSSPP